MGSTEALLEWDRVTPSLLIHVHTVNIFGNACATNLPSILVSLETKYHKCFVLEPFGDGGEVARVWHAASSVTSDVLNVWWG